MSAPMRVASLLIASRTLRAISSAVRSRVALMRMPTPEMLPSLSNSKLRVNVPLLIEKPGMILMNSAALRPPRTGPVESGSIYNARLPPGFAGG